MRGWPARTRPTSKRPAGRRHTHEQMAAPTRYAFTGLPPTLLTGSHVASDRSTSQTIPDWRRAVALLRLEAGLGGYEAAAAASPPRRHEHAARSGTATALLALNFTARDSAATTSSRKPSAPSGTPPPTPPEWTVRMSRPHTC